MAVFGETDNAHTHTHIRAKSTIKLLTPAKNSITIEYPKGMLFTDVFMDLARYALLCPDQETPEDNLKAIIKMLEGIVAENK